jgi:hypothetical protein
MAVDIPYQSLEDNGRRTVRFGIARHAGMVTANEAEVTTFKTAA